MDHESGSPVVIISTEGGMEIETIAEENPEKILKIFGEPLLEVLPYKIRKLFKELNIDPSLYKQFSSIILTISLAEFTILSSTLTITSPIFNPALSPAERFSTSITITPFSESSLK